jgi:long-chain acyl-CoA synthetase
VSVFVTGATGFLGRHLVRRLVEGGERVVLLVRGRDDADAAERVRRALASVGDGGDLRGGGAVTVCRGALDAPGLGLGAADRDVVLGSCESFLHCGASVRLDLPLERARAVNVAGTRAMLDLARERARRGPFARFDYVGTAYVAGRRTDVVFEPELEGRLGHKNSYEQSKFEAEGVVRAAGADLPVCIFRPSIVVGESDSGRTTSFNMIYWPARMYASGLWRTLPGNPDAPVDLVPVNFVRDALLAIRRQPASLGRCFHVAAGPEGFCRLGRITEVLQEFLPGRKPVRFVDPAWWMRWVHPVIKHLAFGAPRRIVRHGEHYVPYFVANPRFDNTGTRELLRESGVAIPSVEDYLRGLFRFCLESNWGRSAS